MLPHTSSFLLCPCVDGRWPSSLPAHCLSVHSFLYLYLFPKSDFLFSCHCQHVCLITGTSKCFSQIHWRSVYVALVLNCGWLMSVWLCGFTEWQNQVQLILQAYSNCMFCCIDMKDWKVDLSIVKEKQPPCLTICVRDSQTNTEFLRLILIIN